MSLISPKKEMIRSNSLLNKEKIRHENSIDSHSSKIKEKKKHKEKDKEKEKEREKEKEKEVNKLIKNILSINLAELKEAIHKEYLQFQHRINDSIQNYSQKLKNISACEKRLIEQFADIKMKMEKVETTSDKLNNVDDRVTTYEIRLTNLLRDFQSACTKYDSLFIDNMTVPGKIGNYCQYRNIREFLSYAFNKFNEFDLKKESDNAKMKNNQEKIEKFTKKIKVEMDILREESIQISNKKVGLVEKKLTEEIDVINNKIASIPNNILLCDIEKRMNDCIADIKNMKDEINNKLKDLESEIETLKELNKSSKTLIYSPKKDVKTTFTNLTGSKFHRFRKNDSAEHHKITKKTTASSKNIHKSISLHGHKSHFYKEKNNNNSIETEQTANLDNINEEYDESNENSPTNNIRIKPKNYYSHNFKFSEKSLDKKDNKKIRSSKILTNTNIKELVSNSDSGSSSEGSEENKSEDHADKLNINNLNDQKRRERSSSFNEHIDLFISNSNEMIKNINNVKSNRSHKGKRKAKNSFSYPSEKKNNNEMTNLRHINSLKMHQANKIENIPKHNNKSGNSTKEIRKKKENESSPLKIKEHSLSHKKDLIVAKNNVSHNINHNMNHNINSNISHNINPINNLYKNNNINNINNENYINNNNNNINKVHNKINSITITSFNNIKDDTNDKNINININANIINNNNNIMNNSKIQSSKNNIIMNNISNNNNLNKTQKLLNIQNIELSNNNNNRMIHHFSQKIVAKNKSYENPKVNNNYSTSVSVGSITDNSFLANIHFTNKEINNKKEIPIKQAYFNLFKLECLKKEELLKNGPSLFIPQEIPIITNSSVQSKSQSNSQSHSNPKKKPKNEKTTVFSKNKISSIQKNQEKDRNIKLKIVPTNFKESKKIQINN